MWSSKVHSSSSASLPSNKEQSPGSTADDTVLKGKRRKWKSDLIQRRADEGFLFQNVALRYAAQVLRSESSRINGSLMNDFASLLAGNAVYIRNFLCPAKDRTFYDQLKAELVEATGASMSLDGGLIEWSKHQVFENPSNLSNTFNEIIDMLSEYFDLDVYATRLNYYRDGTQWKPQHHDSHAYGDRSEREDFTAGLTLGSDRGLLFVHVESGQEFMFPQNNGDCFAFTGEVNKLFTHGVPRANSSQVGDRFSIIAWGRRKSINGRNGGGIHSEALEELGDRRLDSIEDAVSAAHTLVSRGTRAPLASTDINTAGKKKKKNRLQ
eukprot:gene10853-7519_t